MSETSLYPRSATRRAALAGQESARLAVRLAFAAAFADSITLFPPRSRAEAEGLRQRLAAIFDPIIASPLLEADTLAAVIALYGAAVEWVVRAGLDLAPVVRVTAAESLPATLLAWQLYQDPARAIDLVDRNSVGTPFFMPAILDAEKPL